MEQPVNPIVKAPSEAQPVNRGAVNIPLAALMQQAAAALYCNGFEISVTGADICVSLAQNGRLVATLNVSFTTAKALGSGLAALTKDIEQKTNAKIPSVDDVAKALDMQK